MEHAVEPKKYAGQRFGQTPRSNGAPVEISPFHPVLQLQQEIGNQAVQGLLRSGQIRAKLAISQPDDPEEREADEVAGAIMRKAAGAPCSCSEGGELCEECTRKEPALAIQRRPSAPSAPAQIPRIVGDVLRTPGHPLDSAARAFFEPRFGRDLSRVRVHTDERAAQSALAVNALAYTVGSDVVFASGRHATESTEGLKLLAHELTHVIQQDSAASACRIDAPPSATLHELPLANKQDGGFGLQVPARSPLGSAILQRQPTTDAPPPNPLPTQADVAKLGTLSVQMQDAALKDQLRDLFAKQSVEGMRSFVDQVKEAVANKLDESGASDEVQAARRIKSELLDNRRIDDTVVAVIHEAHDVADNFEKDARVQMDHLLAAEEDRTKAEVLHYGLPVDFVNVPMGQPFTFTGAFSETPGIKGLSETAKALVRRREEIIELRKKVEASRGGEGQGDSASTKLDDEIADKDTAYEVLLDKDLAIYPVLARFTQNRDDLDGLRKLATQPGAAVQELVGNEILKTLLDIREVRQNLSPGGDVDIFEIPKMVALAKGAQGITPGSFKDRAVDDRGEETRLANEIGGKALLVLNLALTVAAPLTGGASLILAAGISTATALEHTQDYLLQSAMAGSDLDKAKALSMGDPSLLWLALDWVTAFLDIGTAAQSAAKLAKGYKAMETAARDAKAAQTAVESTEKLDQLEAVAAREGGSALGKTVVRDAERLGGIGGKERELAADLTRAEQAVDVSKEALTGASKVTTEAGGVSVTEGGQLLSCYNPCLNPRMRWAKSLLKDNEAMGKLESLEHRAEEAAKGTMASRDALAREFATLDDQLARGGRQAVAREIAAWLPIIAERYPILKTLALDEDAIARIIAKRTKSAIKGQLVEELASKRVLGMIESGEIAAKAGTKPELIPGYTLSERIINAKGQEQFIQFTDGIIGFRDGEKIEAVAIAEAKAGAFSGSKLEAETVSLERLSKADQRQLRIDAINDFQAEHIYNSEIRGMTREEIDKQFKEQIDAIVKRNRIAAGGQPERDVERLLEGQVYETLSDGTRRKLILKGGRKTTKIIGFTPSDVTVDAAGIAKRGPLSFEQQQLPIDSEAVEALADEISERATGL